MVRYYGSSAIGIGMIECFLLVNTLTNNHSGTIELTQAGTSITGYSNWSTHSNGPITGTINGDSINFKITYPDGIGYYSGLINCTGDYMGGLTTSSRVGDSAIWESKKITILPQ